MHSELGTALQDILQYERQLYLGDDKSRVNQMRRSCNRRYVIWQYLVAFRKCQYWKAIREDRSISRLRRLVAKWLHRYYDKRRNMLSERCGVEIGIDAHVGKGIDIWHGGIVINGHVGDNCTFHGNNIIGNKGKGREKEFPTLDSSIDVGAGATIIGKVEIADGCVIGAGAVVTKSFHEKQSVLVGVPAKQAKEWQTYP